jgi:hypothetical protein
MRLILNKHNLYIFNRQMYLDILKDENLTTKQLYELIANHDSAVRLEVLNHKNVTRGIITSALLDDDVNVRETAQDKLNALNYFKYQK